MENCPAEENISRFLDGELQSGAASRLEEHLEACPRCREAAERLRRAGDFLLRAAAGGTPPPARLDRMIAEKFYPAGEIFLGTIEFALSGPSASPAASSLDLAAEPGADYRTGRRVLAGGGIEAAVEIVRRDSRGVACRVRVRDRSGKILKGIRLRLERDGREVWSGLSGEEKESVIPRLHPGSYRLRIESGRTCGLVLNLR